jgi:DNA-binding MarR family transcriptional regulator
LHNETVLETAAAPVLESLEARLARGLREDAAAVGRAESTARVLLALDPAAGTPMGRLASRIDRDASTVTRFVQRAMREGLVERRTKAGDRRTRLLVLTASGRETRAALLRLRTRRAEALREEVRARTGLGEQEVAWFLDAVDGALAPRPRAATRA